MPNVHARTAVTGGIAEGKSAVLAILASRGFSVASADEAARAVFREPGTNAALAALIGAEAPITGAELGAALAEAQGAGDHRLRRRVNALMHPRVRARMDAGSDGTPAGFDEVPLLLETCLQGRYDAVWSVECSPETKAARLRARYGEGGFAAIAAGQLPNAVRAVFADVRIVTDGTLAETEAQVDRALAARH